MCVHMYTFYVTENIRSRNLLTPLLIFRDSPLYPPLKRTSLDQTFQVLSNTQDPFAVDTTQGTQWIL